MSRHKLDARDRLPGTPIVRHVRTSDLSGQATREILPRKATKHLAWIILTTAITLCSQPPTALASDSAAVHQDTTREVALASPLTQAARGEERSTARLDALERSYDRILDNIYWSIWLATGVVALIVAVFGAAFPLIQQKRARDELKDMLAHQTEQHDARLRIALAELDKKADDRFRTLKTHSENLSTSMLFFALGTESLYRARSSVYYWPDTFANFAKCLNGLTRLMQWDQLPFLYNATLLGILECAGRQWGGLSQTYVQQVRTDLLFLRERWKEHPLIAPHVRSIEDWLSGPPDKGEPLFPKPSHIP